MPTPPKQFHYDVAFVTVTVNMAGVEYTETRTVPRPARDYSDVKASLDTAFNALFSRVSR